MSELPPFAVGTKPKFTERPVPGWKYGQKVDTTPEGKEWVEGESAGFKFVDTATFEPMKLYALMISGIVPRPVAFVSTISESGVENLAPFSWFNMVTFAPPTISISVSHTPAGLKDTARNIFTTKEFTVSIISHPWVENANAASVDTPADVSEWPLSGLTKEASTKVKPPRVKESAFSMECELFHAHEIVDPATGKAGCTLILGLVKGIHVRNDVLNERGLVDPTKFNAVGRLGDVTYSRQGDIFRIVRGQWAADEEAIREVTKGLQ